MAGAHERGWSLASYVWNTEGKIPYSLFLYDVVWAAGFLAATVVFRRKQEWVVRLVVGGFVVLLADRLAIQVAARMLEWRAAVSSLSAVCRARSVDVSRARAAPAAPL